MISTKYCRAAPAAGISPMGAGPMGPMGAVAGAGALRTQLLRKRKNARSLRLRRAMVGGAAEERGVERKPERLSKFEVQLLNERIHAAKLAIVTALARSPACPRNFNATLTLDSDNALRC